MNATVKLLPVILLSTVLLGCEPSGSDGGHGDQAGSATAATPAKGNSSASDAVSFSSLNWTFGGFDGSGAAPSDVSISGLSFSPGSLSFRYDRDLSAWGLSHGNASALCCLFVKRGDGKWVGGKFDWISSSRTTRDLSNARSGYNGWSLAGVPNPCKAALVIVSGNGTRRSNVITGTWQR